MQDFFFFDSENARFEFVKKDKIYAFRADVCKDAFIMRFSDGV